MIDQNTFEQLTLKAQSYPLSSMNYVDYEEVASAEVLANEEGLIVLHNKKTQPEEIHYAAHSAEAVLDFLKLNKVGGLIKFIPMTYIEVFESIGFKLKCIFSDFFNPDLAQLKNESFDSKDWHFAALEQAQILADISQTVKGQSRGFNGETVEFFNEWLSEDKVLIKTVDEEPVGFCCVSVYNEGTTLWIRELAVKPEHQGKGYAKALLKQAIQYGIQQGAHKGFLATDLENHNAIHLYKQFGFVQKENAVEVQMTR